MKIAIGNDHGGYEMKDFVVNYLKQHGHEVVNYGADSAESSDYPIYGEAAARAVASGECDCAVLICGTGVGISIAANKVKGVRAAVCSEPFSAKLARQHNNANAIAFGARVIGIGMAELILESYLNAEFEGGGRHTRRVDMLGCIE